MVLLDDIFANRLKWCFLARNQDGCEGLVHLLLVYLVCLTVPRGQLVMPILTTNCRGRKASNVPDTSLHA